jgi:hypothetical protein
VRRDRLLRMQALLAQLLAASFSSDELCVVQGDGAQPGMRLMEEEIVGPVLLVLVVVQSWWARGDLLYPPHGPRFKRVMGWLRRLA